MMRLRKVSLGFEVRNGGGIPGQTSSDSGRRSPSSGANWAAANVKRAVVAARHALVRSLTDFGLVRQTSSPANVSQLCNASLLANADVVLRLNIDCSVESLDALGCALTAMRQRRDWLVPARPLSGMIT